MFLWEVAIFGKERSVWGGGTLDTEVLERAGLAPWDGGKRNVNRLMLLRLLPNFASFFL